MMLLKGVLFVVAIFQLDLMDLSEALDQNFQDMILTAGQVAAQGISDFVNNGAAVKHNMGFNLPFGAGASSKTSFGFGGQNKDDSSEEDTRRRRRNVENNMLEILPIPKKSLYHLIRSKRSPCHMTGGGQGAPGGMGGTGGTGGTGGNMEADPEEVERRRRMAKTKRAAAQKNRRSVASKNKKSKMTKKNGRSLDGDADNELKPESNIAEAGSRRRRQAENPMDGMSDKIAEGFSNMMERVGPFIEQMAETSKNFGEKMKQVFDKS